jgi:hypothetical protein
MSDTEILISQIINAIIADAVNNYIKLHTPAPNPNNFRDVHAEYDNKYVHNITTKYTLDEKKIKFELLLNELKDLNEVNEVNENKEEKSNEDLEEKNSTKIPKENKINLDLRGIITVINDTQKPQNFDNINNLYADDVLIEIINTLDILSALDLENYIKNSVYLNIIEQMNDMITLGSCAQGRTNRLMQIYKSLLE